MMPLATSFFFKKEMISWLTVIKAFACRLMALTLNGSSTFDGVSTMRNRNAVSQFEGVMIVEQPKKTGHAELTHS